MSIYWKRNFIIQLCFWISIVFILKFYANYHHFISLVFNRDQKYIFTRYSWTYKSKWVYVQIQYSSYMQIFFQQWNCYFFNFYFRKYNSQLSCYFSITSTTAIVCLWVCTRYEYVQCIQRTQIMLKKGKKRKIWQIDITNANSI